MGSQTAPTQGLPPGEKPTEEEQSRLEAVGTVLGLVAAVVVAVIAAAYFGGWVSHVLVDIAVSGWESK